MPHTFTSSLGAAGLLAALAGPALAQAPTLTASQPGRHAPSASRTGAVQLTFSQAVTGAGGLRVHGNRWRGYRAGAAGGDGTPTLTMQPAQAFAPGEEVSVSVPASVRGAGTGGQALASGQVLLFRAATGPATGSFTSGPTLAADNSNGPYLFNAVLTDVTNDGRLDLLQQDRLNDRAVLRVGNGQGGFGASQVVGTDVGEYQLVLADFNNDGSLDLATPSAGGNGTRNIRVQLGAGTGTFGTATTVLTNTQQPLYLQAADVNADGNQDLLYIHYTPAFGTSTQAAELRVGLGNGQGGFTNQTPLTLPAGYGGLWVTDVDNDGRLDCLVLNTTTGRLSFYQGNGQGAFTLAATPALTLTARAGDIGLPTNNGSLNFAADFTGDGKVDLVLPDPTTGALGVYAGTGQGTFGAATTLAAGNVLAAGVGDLEGDGDLDVVVTTGTTGSSAPTNVTTPWLNNGSGSFTAGTAYTQNVAALGLGDLNNDGTLDMLLYDAARITIQPMFYTRLGQPLATAPTITQATANAASTSATVTGTNLGTATTVLVGGQAVAFTVSNGVLTVTLPAGYSGYLTVITPAGTVTSSALVSGTLAVRAATAGRLAVELYPVPAHEAVQLRLPGAATAQASLYDALGRLAYTTTLAAPAGQPVALPLTGLAPGLYTLRLVAGPDVAVRQLLVE